MKQRCFLLVILLLLAALLACGKTAAPDRSETAAIQTSAPAAEAAAPVPATPSMTDAGTPSPEPTPVAYPYLDENGYYHYPIRLNGELLPLAHDALLQTGGTRITRSSARCPRSWTASRSPTIRMRRPASFPPSSTT